MNTPILSDKSASHPDNKQLKLTTLLLPLLFIFLTVSISLADSEFRIDKSFGGRWHDAEKSLGNRNDDWLCWASTASNILAWTGWGVEPKLIHEDNIFQYYSRHWSDNPSGSPREAWRWWFNGQNHTENGATVLREGGSFWPQELFPPDKWGHRSGSLFRGVGQYQLKRNPYILSDMLKRGYGIVLQIVRPLPDNSRDSHMVTLWGFRHSAEDQFKGILVTDSDDAKDSAAGRSAQDSITYYPVKLRDGFWWITYRKNEWKILAAYGLMHKATYKKM